MQSIGFYTGMCICVIGALYFLVKYIDIRLRCSGPWDRECVCVGILYVGTSQLGLSVYIMRPGDSDYLYRVLV